MTLAELNRLPQDEFIAAIGWVFENSPWVAERVWKWRPFDSLDQLSNGMNHAVEEASAAEKVALLRAHPDLGTRAKVSPASTAEQAGAGLDQLTFAEYEELSDLNRRYREKFGFPFLYAVKGSGKSAILESLRTRLDSAPEAEFETALCHVHRIARFRLRGIIEEKV
jgi:OHCU decarboxylase